MDWLEIKEEYRDKAAAKIHKAIKCCFSVRSFADLTTSEFEKIMATLRMIGLREWKICIPEPDEKGRSITDMTMREFLKLKKLMP